jgi:hypothetical protein
MQFNLLRIMKPACGACGKAAFGTISWTGQTVMAICEQCKERALRMLDGGYYFFTPLKAPRVLSPIDKAALSRVSYLDFKKAHEIGVSSNILMGLVSRGYVTMTKGDGAIHYKRMSR